MKFLFCFFPPVMNITLLIITFLILPGCYTLKQGSALLGYLNRAILLESLLELDADEIETEKNRLFVELVMDIRSFAKDELGLELGKNYSDYVKIDRDYLAAVVSASAADSFDRYEWKYPIVGSMPYKGFFKDNDAIKEKNKLEKKSLDVWVRPVEAFSTLGWFKDPLYSYMRDYPPDRLADLIIHESLHATVFIKGAAEFNEELAEFVGREGSRLFMEYRYGIDSDEYKSMTDWTEDNRNFIDFIQNIISRLQDLYDSGKSKEEKLKEKERIINIEKERFETNYDDVFVSHYFRKFSDIPVNNAYLDMFRLYFDEDDYIKDLYDKSGLSLAEFIEAAKKIPNRTRNPRESLMELVKL